MVKPYLLLDIDGVCLDWETGLTNFMKDNMRHIIEPKFLDEHAYELSNRFGISKDEANSLVWDFHYSEEFENLHPFDGVVDSILKLNQKYDCVAITACGSDSIITAARTKNLKKCFGDAFVAIHCVDLFSEKRKFLEKYPPSHWVEDHAQNAQMGLLYGHQCWLINAPYNKKSILNSKIKRINSINDLCDIIL